MSKNVKPILVVQGAQWGSEAKGMVAAALCGRRNVAYAVRTGTVNAGHTVYKHGIKYVNQQLPTGWVNPGTALVIGPGAYISPEILKAEIEMLTQAGWNGGESSIFIDRRCGIHLPEHAQRSDASGRHYRIGATGKGCSEAVIDRIRNRGREPMLFKDWVDINFMEPWMEKFTLGDTAKLLNNAYDRGDQILIEGCQGTLLDLCLGPYPYVTHKQTTAAQWVTEAGLSPALEYEVVLVARTYPIRVAGNSGPMDNEIDWPTLAGEINAKRRTAHLDPIVNPGAVDKFVRAWISLSANYTDRNVEKSERNRDAMALLDDNTVAELRNLFEFTTVTKKLRRVAPLSIKDLQYSVMLNRPKWLCLTFLNYEFPSLWGLVDDGSLPPPLVKPGEAAGAHIYVRSIEEATGVPVGAVTTGPESKHFHDIDR